jgi:hypothetical protein
MIEICATSCVETINRGFNKVYTPVNMLSVGILYLCEGRALTLESSCRNKSFK